MNKTFPIELEESLHKRAKIAAIHEGVTLHDWIIKTLEEKLDANGSIRGEPRKRENTERRNAR